MGRVWPRERSKERLSNAVARTTALFLTYLLTCVRMLRLSTPRTFPRTIAD